MLSIFSSKDGSVLHSLTLDCCARPCTGGLLSVEDIDGDGIKDIALVVGGTGDCASTLQFVSVGNGKALFQYHPALLGSWAYCSLAGLSDLDGDGTRELVCGFADAIEAVNVKKGEFRWITRSPSAEPEDPSRMPKEREGFGAHIVPVGDINGDGLIDYAHCHTGIGLDSGSVLARSGKDGKVLWKSTGSGDGDNIHYFGYDLAVVGDVNGDRIADLIVGTNSSTAGLFGLAFLISGKDGHTIFEYRRTKGVVVAKRVDGRH